MQMDMHAILYGLQRFSPELVSGGGSVDVTAIKFYTTDMTYCDREVLYIARAQDLPAEGPPMGMANLVCLCTEETEIPGHYLSLMASMQIVRVYSNGDGSMLQIYNCLMDMIRVRQHPDSFSERLLKALSLNQNPQQILDMAYSYIGNPLIIVNSCFSLVAHSGMGQVENPYWEALKRDGFPSYELLSSYSEDQALDRLGKSMEPELVQSTLFKIPQLAISVRIHSKTVATVICIAKNHAFGELDYKVLSLLGKGLAMIEKRHPFIEYAKGMPYEYLMMDILDERLDPDTLPEKTKYIDIPLQGNFFAIAVDVGSAEYPRMMLNYMRESLERVLPTCRTVIYFDHIVVCFNCKSEGVLPQECVTRLSATLKQHGLRAGVSRCFRSLQHLRTHYEQALQALKLSRIMRNNDSLSFYEEYAPYQLFDVARDQLDLRELCDASLLGLWDYDEKYGTANCATLYTFLCNERSITNTAAELGLHQNSLRYRIKRIQEILGNSLEDSYYRFRLNLSFFILNYLGVDYMNRKNFNDDLPTDKNGK